MFACAPARRRTPSKRSRYRGGEGRRLSGRLRRLLAPVCVAEARRRCEGKAPRKERRAALGRRAARRSRPSEAPRALPAPTRGPGRTRCPQRSRRRAGLGEARRRWRLLGSPPRSGPGVPRQVPAPRAARPAGRPGAALTQELRSPGRSAVSARGAGRGGGLAGGRAAAEGEQANAGAATSGLQRRAPAAPGASGDIGPRQLKGEDGLRSLVESETFVCARCRHVSRYGQPRQEAPQREYPAAVPRRRGGPGASAPAGRPPLSAPSPAGGRCPRPRRPPPSSLLCLLSPGMPGLSGAPRLIGETRPGPLFPLVCVGLSAAAAARLKVVHPFFLRIFFPPPPAPVFLLYHPGCRR